MGTDDRTWEAYYSRRSSRLLEGFRFHVGPMAAPGRYEMLAKDIVNAGGDIASDSGKEIPDFEIILVEINTLVPEARIQLLDEDYYAGKHYANREAYILNRFCRLVKGSDPGAPSRIRERKLVLDYRWVQECLRAGKRIGEDELFGGMEIKGFLPGPRARWELAPPHLQQRDAKTKSASLAELDLDGQSPKWESRRTAVRENFIPRGPVSRNHSPPAKKTEASSSARSPRSDSRTSELADTTTEEGEITLSPRIKTSTTRAFDPRLKLDLPQKLQPRPSRPVPVNPATSTSLGAAISSPPISFRLGLCADVAPSTGLASPLPCMTDMAQTPSPFQSIEAPPGRQSLPPQEDPPNAEAQHQAIPIQTPPPTPGLETDSFTGKRSRSPSIPDCRPSKQRRPPDSGSKEHSNATSALFTSPLGLSMGFHVIGTIVEQTLLNQCIEAHGGTLSGQHSATFVVLCEQPDAVLTPEQAEICRSVGRARAVVSWLWIEDCKQQGVLLELSKYRLS